MHLSEYWSRSLAAGAQALGMLMISSAIGGAVTFLSFRLLSTVVAAMGPLRLILAILATVVALAEFMHLTQPSDKEATEYEKLHPVRD